MENLLILGIVGYGIFAGLYLLERLWYRKDINKLLNRVMTRSYEEFRYYEDKYPRDLKELDSIREQEKKMRDKGIEELDEGLAMTEDEEIARKIDEFEEDWNMDEINTKKLKEITKDVK